MRRILSLLLTAAFLGGPLALPAAHEWRVARDEAGRHQAAPAGAALAAPKAPDHRHHDERACRVCPQIAQSRAAGAGHAVTAAAPEFRPLSLLTLQAAPLSRDAAGAASPRGPPASA